MQVLNTWVLEIKGYVHYAWTSVLGSSSKPKNLVLLIFKIDPFCFLFFFRYFLQFKKKLVVRPKEDADGFFWGLDSSFVAASTINYLSRNIALLQNSNNILHKYLEFNKQSIIFSFQKVSDRMEFILKRTIHSVDSNESLYP